MLEMIKPIAVYIIINSRHLYTGTGLWTAAGIPDFRSKHTGLYANLQKYNLPSPQSIFDIDYF